MSVRIICFLAFELFYFLNQTPLFLLHLTPLIPFILFKFLILVSFYSSYYMLLIHCKESCDLQHFNPWISYIRLLRFLDLYSVDSLNKRPLMSCIRLLRFFALDYFVSQLSSPLISYFKLHLFLVLDSFDSLHQIPLNHFTRLI